ncbi:MULTISPECIES: arsenate reductase ArsC [Prosthecochloris]|uniref:Arsenate reductase n=1 Tax=Prosthecochloris marina TaxID=2017681 RepID=A0A317T4P9_9CHLB|nr:MULTISPECIES: arsenate reductase ArsC [Prosthecochloris]PWW81739.1 arsenate reductase [Prosthecochloris marina]UZJ38430.1 arsenate reductase ArsC [Prosthecochloris sp. SCSIO W1103]
MHKIRILFLCTGNSCRSQMAEGWARYLHGDIFEPYSAGTEIHGMNQNAIRVMTEAGIDISSHHSKNVEEVQNIPFDVIITVCDHAHENCPFFPGSAKRIHAGFDDPPRLAQSINDPEKKLDCYRKVRDEIRDFIAQLPDALQTVFQTQG